MDIASTNVAPKYSHEEMCNRFIFKCNLYYFMGMAIVSLFNLFGVFGTDRRITQIGFVAVSAITLVCVIATSIFKYDKKSMKYFLVAMLELSTCTIASTLSFHAVMILILPISYTCIYLDKKLTIYTYIWTVIVITLSTFLSFKFGVCDLNMVFLPVKDLAGTVKPDGTVIGSDFLNQIVWWKLFVYFVFPRAIIASVFVPVSIGISKFILKYNNMAKNLEYLANHDGMTSLYNKTCYLADVKKIYKNEANIGVIYFDANNLKYVNDNFGHEQGDFLISSIASALRIIDKPNMKVYRVGGDEFTAVIVNPLKGEILETVEEFRRNLELMKGSSDLPISAAVGFSSGDGKFYDDICQRADDNMYVDKKKCHERYNVRK